MAWTSEALVADVKRCSHEEKYKELAELLGRQEEHLAQSEPAVLDSIMESLDSNTHTLGIMAALYAPSSRPSVSITPFIPCRLGKLSREAVVWDNVMAQVRGFVLTFSAEQAHAYPLACESPVHRGVLISTPYQSAT